ncbi:hypothetical protein [Streptomyces sp. Je 1-369]|uniref:hypothetical protein n=1 Tax=Streptomyces sp. Je 1-369 TaxID=2966192 RepID=UPI0022866D79|nr:hypothetical protein [Streptomyces sp. Je 1-369]WAL93032.1 hypothetical protein NOO62_00065 [Streptomyces sp. Je 1-369]WAL99948.1 hypothetical protein NOO62_39060 [Streptomyces sp. Je 1-369]
MSMALALAVAAAGLGASAATAQASSSAHKQGPPFPYQDCLKATKNKGESPSQGRWHCDQLVKKGWVLPPNR